MQYDFYEVLINVGLIAIFLILIIFFPKEVANFGIWLHNLLLPFLKPLMTAQYHYLK